MENRGINDLHELNYVYQKTQSEARKTQIGPLSHPILVLGFFSANPKSERRLDRKP